MSPSFMKKTMVYLGLLDDEYDEYDDLEDQRTPWVLGRHHGSTPGRRRTTTSPRRPSTAAA